MTENGNERRFWTRMVFTVVGAVLPLFVLGLIAYGSLKTQVERNTLTLAEKANRETVSAQYEALLRELQAIRTDLVELKRRP